MARYDRDLRDFKIYHTEVVELTQWMHDTVTEQYRINHMKSSDKPDIQQPSESNRSNEISLNALNSTTVARELRQEAVIMNAGKLPSSGRIFEGNAFATYSPEGNENEDTNSNQATTMEETIDQNMLNPRSQGDSNACTCDLMGHFVGLAVGVTDSELQPLELRWNIFSKNANTSATTN
ncbi:hypothetical protein GGR50DRAFT_697678 [Xylaria sp. CBS 124048]|nr:hypothetical protein GGR50DRAFT_697678 [Xylaria sp. CBS 124048]